MAKKTAHKQMAKGKPFPGEKANASYSAKGSKKAAPRPKGSPKNR